MSNLRIFWVVWCCGWALFWMLMGFLTLVTWVLVPLALVAILIPVGESRPKLPPCSTCGFPAVAHKDGLCPPYVQLPRS